MPVPALSTTRADRARIPSGFTVIDESEEYLVVDKPPFLLIHPSKPDGTPVADGTYSVRFSLWSAVSGGTEKWNQTINPVTVRKTFVIVGFVLAFSEIIGAFTESASLTLFLAVFSLSGLGLTTANYWAVTQTLMPGGAIGRVAGLQNTAASVAGIAAPWITGSMIIMILSGSV
jgi:hypothetical protein